MLLPATAYSFRVSGMLKMEHKFPRQQFMHEIACQPLANFSAEDFDLR